MTAIQVPNVQIEFVPLLGELQHGSVALENGFQYFLSLMRPKATGTGVDRQRRSFGGAEVRLQLSGGRGGSPAGSGRRARRPRDGRHSAAGTTFRGEEVTPGAVGTSRRGDRGVPAPAGRNQLPSLLHLPHGPRRQAVVDEAGRVHGLDNVRVVDASILPRDRQRQPERSGDHAGREARGHDPERAAAAAGPGSVLSRLNQQNEWHAS